MNICTSYIQFSQKRDRLDFCFVAPILVHIKPTTYGFTKKKKPTIYGSSSYTFLRFDRYAQKLQIKSENQAIAVCFSSLISVSPPQKA